MFADLEAAAAQAEKENAIILKELHQRNEALVRLLTLLLPLMHGL